MTKTKYDVASFLNNNDTPFTTFENVNNSSVKLNLPLFDTSYDISKWASGVLPDGTPIIKDTTKSKNNLEQESFIPEVNNTDEVEIKEIPLTFKEITIDNSSKANTLSNLIDDVSNEKGFEDLKNPLNKKLLMLLAQRESRYDSSAKSSNSTASGYFLMIDGTRKKFSSVSKDEFLNNPKEQVRAAYKYLRNILDTPNAKKLLDKGYNYAQVTALGWWLPASMNDVLNGNFNRSLGGYSIKLALEDYGQFKI